MEKLKKAKKKLKKLSRELEALKSEAVQKNEASTETAAAKEAISEPLPLEQVEKEKAADALPEEQPAEEELSEKLKQISEEKRVEAGGLLAEMRFLLRAFLQDPQEAICRELQQQTHSAAWLFYALSILPFFITGLLLGGFVSGLQVGILYAILSLVYPFVLYVIGGSRKNIGLGSIYPLFWTSNLGMYLVHGISMILMLLGIWFLALLLELLALPLQMIFGYMAALALAEMDSRAAIRSTVMASAVTAIFLLLLLFMCFGAAFVNSALGQLMDGGLNVKGILTFLLQYM